MNPKLESFWETLKPGLDRTPESLVHFSWALEDWEAESLAVALDLFSKEPVLLKHELASQLEELDWLMQRLLELEEYECCARVKETRERASVRNQDLLKPKRRKR